jgi:hypothetical protein
MFRPRRKPKAPDQTGASRPEVEVAVEVTEPPPASDAASKSDAAEQPDGPGSDPEGDPWDQFAPDPPGARVVERIVHRVLDVLDRTFHDERVLAVIGSVALAPAMTWPVLRHPLSALPEPTASGPLAIGEPALAAWQIAWAGNALIHDPGSLLRTNAFQGGSFGYPLSSGLLGYLPFGMIGSGQSAAIIRYNILFVLAFALATFGGYALVRQLGARKLAAALAGVAFAYAPWRLGQAGHLEVLSTGGIALSLAMLARGHGWTLARAGAARETRPGWAIAGWLLAAWQLTLGYTTAVPFGYVLLIGTVACGISWLFPRRRPTFGWLLRLDLLGVAIVSATAAGLGYLYRTGMAERPETAVFPNDVALSSPPLKGFLTAPAESLFWGGGHDAPRAALSWSRGMAVLPGYFLLALALVGLVYSTWTLAKRLSLLAGVVASVLLAMGTAGPASGRGYLQLYRHVPGFDALRSPSWFVLWTTLLLAILAAGAVEALGRQANAFVDTVRGNRSRVASRWGLRVAALVPVGLILIEGLPSYQMVTVPKAPAALKKVSNDRLPGPVLVLPTNESADPTVLLWSVDGFPEVSNGAPGAPSRLAEIREVAWSFPEQDSIEVLRELGIRTVVVPREVATRAGYAAAARGLRYDEIEFDLGVTSSESREAIVYTLE